MAPGSRTTGTLAADGAGSVTTSNVTVRFHVRRSSTGFEINGVGYEAGSAGDVTIATPLPASGTVRGTSYAVNEKSQVAKLTAIITKDTLDVTQVGVRGTYRENCTRNS